MSRGHPVSPISRVWGSGAIVPYDREGLRASLKKTMGPKTKFLSLDHADGYSKFTSAKRGGPISRGGSGND